MKPKKKSLNFIIDTLAFAAFVFLTTTGVLMYYILPPGSGKHSKIWGMDRHEWGDFHFWIAVAFFGILALHIVLHWKWIVSFIRGKQGERPSMRLGLGLLGTLVLLMIAAAPLITPVEVAVEDSKNHEYTSYEFVDEIRGSLTLEELEKLTGVPAEYVIKKLNIPSNVPRDRKLGELKSEYGFEISQVRNAVSQYKSNDK